MHRHVSESGQWRHWTLRNITPPRTSLALCELRGRGLTMWMLAQSGLHPWGLELVVEIAGQIFQPHGGVPGEHALALVQFLLQGRHIQLSGQRLPW